MSGEDEKAKAKTWEDGRTYKADEDVYIDVLKGSRQFDPLLRFHPPIATAARANRPDLRKLFATVGGEGGGRGRGDGVGVGDGPRLVQRRPRPPRTDRFGPLVLWLSRPTTRADRPTCVSLSRHTQFPRRSLVRASDCSASAVAPIQLISRS